MKTQRKPDTIPQASDKRQSDGWGHLPLTDKQIGALVRDQDAAALALAQKQATKRYNLETRDAMGKALDGLD